MESKTVLEFSDVELNILNDIIRGHKVTISNEELTLLMMGKRTTPLVDLTVKIGSAFEKRNAELQAAQTAAQVPPVTEDEPPQFKK